jgi:hypothetical protein
MLHALLLVIVLELVCVGTLSAGYRQSWSSLNTNRHFFCKFQMGKDVVSFLSWAAEPEMEERKLVNLLPPPLQFSSDPIFKY